MVVASSSLSGTYVSHWSFFRRDISTKKRKSYYTITETRLYQVEKTSNSTGKLVVLTTHHTNYYRGIM
jgi:thiamine phosphate synthase YjbQ (UPF0047 family)